MLRDGRLGSSVDREFAEFTSSLAFDRNLFVYDVLGSIAHAKMLARQGIIEGEKAEKIISGLREILNQGFESLELREEYEDVHIAVEATLYRKIGEPALWLHTARSRNDQVALDLRMLFRDEIISSAEELYGLCRSILTLAEKHINTLMPGYTHLQIAQPTTLAHTLLASFSAIMRDIQRMRDCFSRVNLSPLGACALATTSFPIDRNYTAQLLAFDGIVENAQDAVASRDFITESLSVLAIAGINLSTLCEQIILWSTAEFGFAELPEELSSTSSIMPQKKNPDALEIARARISKLIGNITTALSLLKALPLAYNRDLQELSPVAFDSFRTFRAVASMLKKVVSGLKFNTERMASQLTTSSTATELADFLVREHGLSFRQAHQVVGRAVMLGKGEITAESLKDAFKEVLGKEIEISQDLSQVLNPEKAVEYKKVPGSPSPDVVMEYIKRKKAELKELEEFFSTQRRKIELAYSKLRGE